MLAIGPAREKRSSDSVRENLPPTVIGACDFDDKIAFSKWDDCVNTEPNRSSGVGKTGSVKQVRARDFEYSVKNAVTDTGLNLCYWFDRP